MVCRGGFPRPPEMFDSDERLTIPQSLRDSSLYWGEPFVFEEKFNVVEK